jgi:hypothetical protein
VLARPFYWGVRAITSWRNRLAEQRAAREPSVVKALEQRGAPAMLNVEAD